MNDMTSSITSVSPRSARTKYNCTSIYFLPYPRAEYPFTSATLPKNLTQNKMATLDELSQHRNWFRGDPNLPFTPLVEAYMADSLDLPTTVSKIVQPVNEAWSSGDASTSPLSSLL